MEQVNEIKKILRADFKGKPVTFNDLMNLLGRPKFQDDDKIFEKEFANLVRKRATSKEDQDKFTNHDIKMVFNRYAA